ncbi:MAG: cation transporter [Nitrospinaceae bacterium]|nr:cation transporter [Nitrospinaceae bacterium]MBT3434143.1 cation transporter [Nitrospinaceae bacterium]MBT4092344.1 cation transporter [Nitrospinaceae bacterium]MBT4429910.1 cation transporter [Nitrospinaceae bacterium]MBT5367204.1 cation transporter [Nitrospinaceae bacterium]
MANSTSNRADTIRRRAREGQRVTWIGVWVNAALSLAKAVGGVLGGSQALLADALHSISDLASDAVVLFALHFSGEPADHQHPYGHGRMETIAAFGIGLILLLAGVYMLYRSLGDLWIPRPYSLNFLALPFIVLAIALKEGLYWLTLRVGRRTSNQALIANAWHHRSDAISSIATLVGVTFALSGYWWADALAAAGVAGLVIWAGVRIAHESLDDLVDTAPTEEMLARIRAAIEEVEGVKSVHALRTRRIGPQFFVDVHIQVDATLSVAAGHLIAHRGQDAVLSRVGEVSEVIVHVEPDVPISIPDPDNFEAGIS